LPGDGGKTPRSFLRDQARIPRYRDFKWKGRKPFQAGWHHEDVKFVPCKGMGLFYIFSARRGGSGFSVEGNYQIRYAVMEDIHGMGRVYVDTWKAAYQNMIPKEYLDGLTYESWVEKYRSNFSKTEGYHAAVLLKDDTIIGVVSFMKTRDHDLPETCGEIVSIYVLQEYWQQGFGKMMLNWSVQELKKLGFADCALWTLEDNLRAQRSYENFGFKRDGARQSQQIGGKDIWEIRYRRKI
jgi:GNAT superfamily N-acetyltransferase